MRLTIAVALIVLAALVAAGVARLDDRGELSTDLVATSAPVPPTSTTTVAAEAEVETIVDEGPARVAVVPDKAATQAAEWEAAGVAAVEMAEADAAQPATSTTSTPAAAQPAAPAEPAPQATAPAPRPAPTPPPTQPTPPTPPPSGGGSLYAKLDNIARCESGMNPKAYNPAGPYIGAFQFHLSTWRGLGESGDPRDRSYSYQRDVAARLAQSAGFRASWPHCAAQYGY